MLIEAQPNPITLFQHWFAEAAACAQLREPSAMTLATVDENGAPSARVVLLKDVNEEGFTFYTNIQSDKGRHLAANPNAALCFYWMPLDKQVRVRGEAQPVTVDDADAYFASRPRESQIGAWASDQSRLLGSAEVLKQRAMEFATKFEGRAVPRPPHWSGYRLNPNAIEFWLKGDHRLHDRVLYERSSGGGWTIRRLFP